MGIFEILAIIVAALAIPVGIYFIYESNKNRQLYKDSRILSDRVLRQAEQAGMSVDAAQVAVKSAQAAMVRYKMRAAEAEEQVRTANIMNSVLEARNAQLETQNRYLLAQLDGHVETDDPDSGIMISNPVDVAPSKRTPREKVVRDDTAPGATGPTA